MQDEFTDEETAFMREALKIAAEGIGRTDFAPSIGCVIVDGNRIIARARTSDGGVPHAEETALSILSEQGLSARGCVAYVTLEPCATPDPGANCCCTDLLIKAGISKVIAACGDPDPKTNGKGFQRLKASGIEVYEGLLKAESYAQNPWFYKSRGLDVNEA